MNRTGGILRGLNAAGDNYSVLPHRNEILFIRKQALFSSILSFLTFLTCYCIPDFPFSPGLLWLVMALAIVYMATYVFLWKFFEKNYHYMISGLSIVGLVFMSILVHLSGGIASPFIFLYFPILISEAAYGGKIVYSTIFAVVTYIVVVASEFFGVLTVTNPFSGLIYASTGTTFWIASFVVSFLIISGFVVKFIVTKLRAQLLRENDEKHAILSKLSELEAHSQIGVLAHRIVHDLRGPISSISGYIQVEMMKSKAPEDQEMLRDLNGVVLSMSVSLKGITQFGRVSGGPAERIILADFMRTLIAIVSFSPQARGVKFVKLYPETLQLAVSASRADLQQAYFNIIRNAVEAMRDNSGARQIEVSIKAVDRDVEVSIADNGPGMAPEVLKNLFRKSITTKTDGTGVGLVITRDLLMRNDGTIEFHNLPSGGMWVRTIFPPA